MTASRREFEKIAQKWVDAGRFDFDYDEETDSYYDEQTEIAYAFFCGGWDKARASVVVELPPQMHDVISRKSVTNERNYT